MPEGFSFPAARSLWTPLEYSDGLHDDPARRVVPAGRRAGAPGCVAGAGRMRKSRRSAGSSPRSTPTATRASASRHSAARGDGRRHPQVVLGVARRGRLRAADCVRQRRQPAAGAGGGARERDRGADRARRRRGRAGPAAPDRERDSRRSSAAGSGCWLAVWGIEALLATGTRGHSATRPKSASIRSSSRSRWDVAADRPAVRRGARVPVRHAAGSRPRSKRAAAER